MEALAKVEASRQEYLLAEKKKRLGIDNGDAIAEFFRGVSLDAIYLFVEEEMGIDYRPVYQHLNPGQQRMNLGNRLRSWYKIRNRVFDPKRRIR
jgi:hypothetical protein